MPQARPVQLLVFGDASTVALAACVYVRTEAAGTVRCALLTMKTKVAPANKASVPRLELTSAVMAVNLAQSVKRACPYEILETVYFTDSSATLGRLRRAGVEKLEYEAIRLSEIQTKSDPHRDWCWIAGQNNPADLGTRPDVAAAEVCGGSPFQRGYEWMYAEKQDWPVKKSFSAPLEEEEKLQPCVNQATAETPVRVWKFARSYRSTVNVVAILLQFGENCKSKESRTWVTPNTWNRAEMLVLASSQDSIREKWMAGKMSRFRMEEKVVPGNLTRVLLANLRAPPGGGGGRPEIMVVQANSEVAVWLLRAGHNANHEGVTTSLMRTRVHAWIVSGRRPMKRIVDNCFECKRRAKQLCSPTIGPIPEIKLNASGPFEVVHVDLIGPYLVKGLVKARAQRKVWALVAVCGLTTAMSVELCQDYSADAVVLALTRFTNRFGAPTTIISDAGTQLKAASRSVTNWLQENMITWRCVSPDGQHENGLCEAMIKILKKTLDPELAKGSWNIIELETIISSALRLVNSRPISFTSATEDLEAANIVTPKDFMQPHRDLARHVSIDDNATLCRRAEAVAASEAEMWKMFEVSCFPKRCIPSRWCTTGGPSPQVGDVVMVVDTNVVRNHWRLARVVAVKESSDNVARTVQLVYKKDGGVETSVWRSIRSVALICKSV